MTQQCSTLLPSKVSWNLQDVYCIVASSNARYWLGDQLFVKRSQYIRIKNPLHKQSEKSCMCFKTRWASTHDYTVSRHCSFSHSTLKQWNLQHLRFSNCTWLTIDLYSSHFIVQECKCALWSVAKGHHHHGLLILTFFGSCIQPTVHSSGALKLGDL